MTSENDINDNLIESGRTPPDYTGNSTRNTPPSYGTLIQQLKDAQKKSSSKERLQNTCDILVNSSKLDDDYATFTLHCSAFLVL